MSTNNPPHPKPRESAINQVFLNAWRDDGKLLVQNCLDCAQVYFYPRPFCPGCLSENVEWLATTGRGTVVLATCVHRPNHPAFFDAVPIVLAEVALPEGTSMLARIVGEGRDEATEGMTVELVSGAERQAYPLPTFVVSKENST